MPQRIPEDRLATARRLRRDMTVAEKLLWQALRGRQLQGVKFRRQVPIGPYVADFACLTARLIVELDGAPHDDAEQQDHDVFRDDWLKQQGWKVLRFQNDLVVGGGDIVLDRILLELKRK
jgi:very-short-patch-repair endonuclease